MCMLAACTIIRTMVGHFWVVGGWWLVVGYEGDVERNHAMELIHVYYIQSCNGVIQRGISLGALDDNQEALGYIP